MKKHKEDLITPPWASRPTVGSLRGAGGVPHEGQTLWLTKNGKTSTITKPQQEIPHWRKKYEKDYVVTDTDPALASTCGHECFRLRTGVGCSRCKD